MSDYENEIRGGFPLGVTLISVGVTLAILIPVYIFLVIPYGENILAQAKLHESDYQQLGKQTEKILADSGVSCQQIQDMRTLHIQVTDQWKDPLYWKSNFDTARDLWNAKNCGNHWGWFES